MSELAKSLLIEGPQKQQKEEKKEIEDVELSSKKPHIKPNFISSIRTKYGRARLHPPKAGYAPNQPMLEKYGYKIY